MEKQDSCPICTRSGIESQRLSKSMFDWWINCPRCGEFQISHMALQFGRLGNERARANASSFLYHNWSRDRMVTTEDMEWLMNVPAPTIALRRELLLRHLAQGLGGIGNKIIVEGDQPELLAVSWSIDMSEVNALLAHGVELGHLRPIRTDPAKSFITAKGWDALASSGESNVDPAQIFVAMSFREALTKVYEDGIVLGIRRAGFNEDRVDRREHNKVVYDEILASIRSSRAVVADLTHQSQGTYFEIGFARALGKDVILTCRDDQIDPKGDDVTPMNRVHFDQRHFNILHWTKAEELAYKLRLRIEALLGKGPVRHGGLPPEVKPTE